MIQETVNSAYEHWITEEGADPKPLPKLANWNLLIRPVAVQPKTKGGLILPETARDMMGYLTTVGRVLVVGDLAYKAKDCPEPWCKVGDFVVYPKTSILRVTYKGIRLGFIADKDVLAVLSSPQDIDPHYKT